MTMKDPSEERLIIKEPKCWEYMLYNKKMQIFFVLILCAFIGIGTPFIWRQIWKIESKSCAIESDLRYNCYSQRPSLQQNMTECLNAKCCWDDFATDSQIKCYYGIVGKSDHKMPGFKVESKEDKSAILKLDIFPRTLDIENNKTANGPIAIQKLTLNVKHYTESHFSFKISPQNSTESKDYSNYLDFKPLKEGNNVSTATISWGNPNNDDFTISVRRKQTETLIFNTGDYSPFIFSKGLIEITTLLPNDMIFGLGQSPSKSFKHNMTYPAEWAIFNKHHLNLTNNQSSWFGSHPFYMGLEGDGNAYGVFLLNTYPIEVITNSRPSLTFRTIGGDLDFHFFMGPKPSDVIKQLASLIGNPSLPPYWALGFHLCRTTCDNLNSAKNVLDAMIDKKVPVESDCGSSALSSILFNQENDFKYLKEFYGESKSKRDIMNIVVQVPHKMKYVNIQDIGSNKNALLIAERWNKTNVALKKPNSEEEYIGYFYDWCGESSGVTNKSVIFPSFLDDKVVDELVKDLDLFESTFDGLILNYNTPLDLSYALKYKDRGNKTCKSSLDSNKWDLYHYSEMNEYTPCLDSVHPNKDLLIETHNLYGYEHAKKANEALTRHRKEKDKRNLIMSLSTFTGIGTFAGHMGISMNASWDMLRETIIQTLEFNMYGIPLTGFPVCGFIGQSKDEELCLRWYQLAALQPFMISYRDFNESLTDPISLTKDELNNQYDEKLLQAIASAITIRYRLLPYLYTQFYRANQFGEMVMRPLFFEFPDDKTTYTLDKQYFWGSALMISPVTEIGVKSVKAYFPKGNWYDFYSGRKVSYKDGGHLDLSAVEYHINLHIRGGYVIPTQPEGVNTKKSRENPFTLIAALNSDKSASGELFIDDGISENTVESISKKYLLPKFTITDHKIMIETDLTDTSLAKDTTGAFSTKIDIIKIYGIIDPPYPMSFNITFDDKQKAYNESYISYDPFLGVLTFKNLESEIDLKSYSQYILRWTLKQWDE